MNITRFQVISRGFSVRCPNCGEKTLFQEGRLMKVNPTCSRCGLKIENGDGAFLGPFVINYAITVFLFIVPIIILYAGGHLSAQVAIGAGALSALALPLVFYRLSWGLWLATYYFFLIDNLPANLDGRAEDDQ